MFKTFCRTRLTGLALGLFAIISVATVGVAVAKEYPVRPISLVVPYSPGGGVDLVGRLLAQELSKTLGQPVVLENRPGSGGIIGINAVARAAADGYTLLVVDPALVINPSLLSSVQYKTRDLTPISMLTLSPLVLTSTKSLPVKSVAELENLSKKKGSAGLSFASAGIGTTPHMAGELFKLKSGGNMLHIPYKGSGPAMTDLISGQIDFAFSTIAAAAPFIKEGRLNGLATTGAKRSKLLPDLPTVADTFPDFKVLFWTGLFAPANLPADVAKKLSDAVKIALDSPEMRDGLEKRGDSPAYMTTEESVKFVQSESDMWAKVIEQGHFKPD